MAQAARKAAHANTRGRRAVAAWCRKRSQVALAKLVGVKQQTISRWVRGEFRPEVRERTILEKLGVVTADAWLTREERRDLARFEAKPAA